MGDIPVVGPFSTSRPVLKHSHFTTKRYIAMCFWKCLRHKIGDTVIKCSFTFDAVPSLIWISWTGCIVSCGPYPRWLSIDLLDLLLSAENGISQSTDPLCLHYKTKWICTLVCYFSLVWHILILMFYQITVTLCIHTHGETNDLVVPGCLSFFHRLHERPGVLVALKHKNHISKNPMCVRASV